MGQKAIDFHAALEFARLHKHFAAIRPSKADEKEKRIVVGQTSVHERSRNQGRGKVAATDH